MLFFGGLFAGCALIFAVERVWVWKAMGTREFSEDFRRSLPRVDPFIPLLGLAALVGATVFAFKASQDATVFAVIAIGAVAIVMVVSLTLMEPINTRFRRSPSGSVPAEAERLRTRWRRLHLTRTTLIVIAYAGMVGAAVSTPS
jgi:hypothetical protein